MTNMAKKEELRFGESCFLRGGAEPLISGIVRGFTRGQGVFAQILFLPWKSEKRTAYACWEEKNGGV